MTLEELRIEINECNEELFQVLKKRFSITRKIGKLKLEKNLPFYDKKREDDIIEKVINKAKMENLNEDMVEKIFKIIMEQAVKEYKEIENVCRKNK